MNNILRIIIPITLLLLFIFYYNSLGNPAPPSFFSIVPIYNVAAIIPIKVYSNAEADKDKILKDNQNKSGIYK
jgi:hypothetical protein